MNQYTPPSSNEIKPTNGYGTTGFVLAMVGLFVLPFLLGTLAIIFSAIGLSQENKPKGLAKAGLIIGIINVVWASLIGLVVRLVLYNR